MKTRIAALLMALCLAASVTAQGPVITESIVTQYRVNLNSTTETFCALGNEIPVNVRVADATSTTMTGTGAFTNVAVGDMIRGTDSLAGGGESYVNSVVARASANSITINTALSGEVNPTLTSATLFYRTLTCGATKNDGIIDISKYGKVTIQIDITQLVLAVPGTSTIDTRILCRSSHEAQWLQYYPVLVPPAVTATYVSLAVVGGWAKEIEGTFTECRVGMKINAADDAGDTGTNAEQVSVLVKGSKAQ